MIDHCRQKLLNISGNLRSGSWFLALFEIWFKNQKTNLDFPRIFDNPFAKYLISQSFFNVLAVFLVIYQSQSKHSKKKERNFLAPFCGWSSTASRLQSLPGGSLLLISASKKNLFVKKTLWPLFIDGIRLSQCYGATRRTQFTFYY